MNFTEDLLKDLSEHLHSTARDIEREAEKEGSIQEDVEATVHTLRKLARQIEVINYQPFIFSSILEEYDLDVGPLDEPLENVPLHINDTSPTAQVIIKWRLSNGV